MRQENNGLLKILLLILGVFLGLIIWMNHIEQTPMPEYTEAPLVTGIISDSSTAVNDNTEDDTPQDISEGSSVLKLAIAGDIVPHSGLNTQAKNGDTYDYTEIMAGAKNYLEEADISVTCLETTFSGGPEYSGYPSFKTPDGLAQSLKNIGIDLVSTANDHAMDSHVDGVRRTLDVLDSVGLAHVGTYRSWEEREQNNGITVIEKNGISVAFLAFTFGTGGISIEEHSYVTNVFAKDYLEQTVKEIDYNLIKRNMEAARQEGADVIAVFMHWGQELQTTPSKVQTSLASFLFEEGADIIIGGHPHVPELMELRKITNPDESKRTGFIAYSLGNFISTQNDEYSNITAIANVEIVKDESGKTFIRDANYVPLFMVDLEDYDITPTSWRYQLWDLHAAMDAYDAGDTLDGVINSTLASAMQKGLDDIHGIMGRDYDKYHRYG